jgi:pyruvate/2-oxoglutarate dehydrogenase complex dihydrolipoamide acyltransferase (E2) component
MVEVRLTQFGMGMTDGAVIQWFKALGDTVTQGEPLCEVETAKTTVELASPCDGVLTNILAPVGERIEVNAVIASIDDGSGEAVASGPAAASSIPDPVAVKVRPPDERSAAAQVEPRARRAAEALGVSLDTVVGSGPGGRITEADVLAAAQRTDGMSEQGDFRE